MKNYLKSRIVIIGIISAVFLILAADFINAETICSYKGPDVSQDLLRLTDFSVSGNSALKVGDTITVKFTLQNYGQTDLTLGQRGIFAAARDPDNLDTSFGFTRANTNLKISETVSVEVSRVLDKAGSWTIWPSYHILSGKIYKLGPDNWHSCSLKVAEPPQDSDKDGISDQQDNCPQNYNPKQEDIDADGVGDACDNCDDRDTDQDKIKNCLDKCPNEAENYNQYQDDDGCPDETPKPEDTTSPTVTINYTPPTVNTASNITFRAIAQDNTSVNEIIIYVNGAQVKGCAPPDFAQGFWRCEYSGGPYPAGNLTYKAEAFDPDGNKGVSSEGKVEVQAITFETPPIEAHLPCTISGKLLDFKYSSKTVRVKFCEAETVGGGCSPTPPFTCVPASTACKEGGEVWYADVNRVWSGEETYRNPGPLSYQTQVPCEGSYLIQPVYKEFEEECEWKGTWRPTKGNLVTMEGANKSDYDFRFTPQDLTPPSIQTRTTDVARPATFKGEGGFTLYVEAIDSTDGVKSEKVSGTYRVSYFKSDATGPLESRKADATFTLSQECGLWYRGSSTIPHASCRFDIPYYEGGKSITFDLRISACDAAGNKVETTYSHTFPDEPGDLALATVEPIQVIYGAPLVKNKNTAFRAKVNSSFPYPVEASFRLTLPPDKWDLTNGTGRILLAFPVGWSFPDLWGPIKIPANASNYEIMLPIIADWQKEISGTGAGDATKILRGEEVSGIYGVDVRLMPVPKADQVNFSVQIDPENQIRETNEGGNTFNSPNYNIVKTKTWRFLVVPYKDDRGCVPYRPFVEAGVKKYLEYLLATYPIAEYKLEYAFATTPYSQRCTHDPSLTCEFVRTMNRGAGELRQWTARLAEEEGYDFGIAVGCSGGQANFNVMAVTVGDSGGEELLAHEFNHAVSPVSDIYSLDCYSSWLESYCELPDGNRFYCCWQNYNDEKERREENGIDPMEGCIIDCGQDDRGDCNAGCCWDRCKAECDDRGGTTWQAPDGRPSIMGIMPAADGFWVNKWVEKEGKQYFMDGPTGDNWISARSVREEGYHYCPSPDIAIDYDGYLNMLTHARFVSATDPEGLLVSGTINKNGEVKFDPFIYLPETVLDIEPGGKGNYYFVLSDKDNKVLSKTGFDVYFYQSDPYGGPIDEDYFVYRIEWKEGTKKIELQDKTGEVLASREVSENEPEIKVIYPNGGEVITQGKKIKIKWEANDKDGDVLTYSISLSKDNGQNWLPVDIDVGTNEYEIDTTSLSPTDYLVKITATDGVNTSIDFSDSVFSVKTDGKSQSSYVIYLIVILTIMAIIIAFVIYRSKFVKKK